MSFFVVAFTLTTINVIIARPELGTQEQNISIAINDIENRTLAKYVASSQSNQFEVKLLDTQCTREYSCVNCTMVRVCAPQSRDVFVEVSRAVCPLERPLCDPKTGSCVAHAVSECVKPSSPRCFKQKGFFPHPADCTKFFYCSDYRSFLFQCPESKNYDVQYESCATSACYTIDCANQDGRKVQYPFSNRYFSYCSGGSPVGMDSCDGTDVFNTTSQVCEPSCDLQSFIRDPKDCTKYYRCDYEWINGYRAMVKIHDRCPAGHTFDDVVFQCLPREPDSDCFKE